MGRVSRRTTYGGVFLDTCTAALPNGLGIPDSVVLATPETQALSDYITLLFSAAKNQNWVMSLVAMIPCIQVSLLQSCVHGLLINSSLIT